MNLLRRVAAGLIMGSVLLSGTSFAAFPDVPENAYYAEAVDETKKRGFFQGDHEGNFNPDSEITRAEFAVLMCRLSKTNVDEAALSVFTDMSNEHWANGYIAAATEAGILKGFEDGTFRPSEAVTGEQAVKMVVCALGFGEEAEKLGAYPKGYIALATEKGLVQTEVNSEGFLRKDSAMLIYNAVKLMEESPEETPETVTPSRPVGGGSSKPGRPSTGDSEQTDKEENSQLPEKEEVPEEEPENQPEFEEAEKPEADEKEEIEKIPFGEGLNLKQEEGDSCTAAALTMLLRRLYYTNGADYSHITEAALKNNEKVWLPEVGLYNEIEFEGFRINKKFFEEETDKVAWFKEVLPMHPEGIIIYDTDMWHAVVLTDYRDGVFYASDPATGLYTSLERVTTISGETEAEKLNQIDAIWIFEKQ